MSDGNVFEDEAVRNSVGVFRSNLFPGRYFAATCNHGTNENIPEGSTLKIYNKGWIIILISFTVLFFVLIVRLNTNYHISQLM